MTDRRRINGPPEGTTPPTFLSAVTFTQSANRSPKDVRKIFLKTSLTPPATGSAFLELPSPAPPHPHSPSTLKLTASVYGPRPLPPSSSTPFSPHARITAELKFAPFATAGKRRGYVRDAVERDLSVQLQSAIAKGVVGGRYPKSCIDIFVTVLDCEGDEEGGAVDVGLMGVLAGAITCASAAIADAGIECFDMVSGGVAAVVVPKRGRSGGSEVPVLVLDPSPADGGRVLAAAVVGYMAARDELALVWTLGSVGKDGAVQGGGGGGVDDLIDGAVSTATVVRGALNEAVKERLLLGIERAKKGKDVGGDTVMV